MDELAPQSTAQVSTGRRRLKTIILVVAGIVVLTLGAVGYLTYNTVCNCILLKVNTVLPISLNAISLAAIFSDENY